MAMAMDTVMDTMMIKNNIQGFISHNPLYRTLLDKFSTYLPQNEFKNHITIDLHSHLLPGIDDGVRTIDESIKIIKKFKALGYTKLITTPHIISDSYPNTKTIIEENLKMVKNAIKEEGIDIEIEAGAEHYVDMEFLADIKADRLVPFCDKYILFETSYISKPMILEQAIFDMQSKGYVPVLAHPERYHYMQNDIESYIKLKDLGVLFQMNIKSLRNTSNIIYKVSLKLMKLGLIDFIGSDAHRMRDMNDLERIVEDKTYQLIFENNKILNMSKLV